jgi:tRNA dimethylallyltransferase
MDIGTAKPSLDTRRRIPHHMIDVADVSDEFTVAEFQRQGRFVLDDAVSRGDRLVVAGGSGLHFRALVDPMTFAPTDPNIRRELEAMPLDDLQHELLAIDIEAPDVLDIRNQRRVIRAIEVWRITARTPSDRARSDEAGALRAYESLVDHVSIGLDSADRSAERIGARFKAMLDAGLLDEVTALGLSLGRTAVQAVGYKELLGVVVGDADVESASIEAIRATSALVKRQRTYFGRDPRIEWMPWQDDEDARIRLVVDHVGEVAGWTS